MAFGFITSKVGASVLATVLGAGILGGVKLAGRVSSAETSIQRQDKDITRVDSRTNGLDEKMDKVKDDLHDEINDLKDHVDAKFDKLIDEIHNRHR